MQHAQASFSIRSIFLPSFAMMLSRFVRRLLPVLLAAGLLGIAVPGHAQTSTRLAAFENTTLDGTTAPFVIEEMQVGDIRHIVDYLLLHGRYSFNDGNTSLAAAHLQWAASLMDLNAGLADTPEQANVRSAAADIDELAQKAASGAKLTPSDEKRFFNAHHALSRYHQRRAVALLQSIQPASRFDSELIRENAIFQKKAGLALSAALTHFDRATTILAELQEMPVADTHEQRVNETYLVVKTLKLGNGEMTPEKAVSSAKALGQSINDLNQAIADLSL